MQTIAAEAHIKGLCRTKADKYESYFKTIAPKSVEDVFKRWLFAYASVHTTWERNCILYDNLKDLEWLDNYHLLKRRIEDSRAGLHNNRANFIMQFSNFYWKHPFWFNKNPNETWFQYRDRIMAKAPGIGNAKAAFLLELVYFHKSRIACFDTHMIQLYGYEASQYGQGKVPDSAIKSMEQHWSETCIEQAVSPVTARWLYWDQKQNQSSPTYWTHVLEEKVA
jgi:hypothetical protein